MENTNERGVFLMRKKKKTDERVQAEINRIYKVGYLILTIGIGVDTFLQVIDSPTSATIRPLEILVFLLAQVVCLAMMVRKGFSDDNQYAEADVFPAAHTLKSGILAGLCSAVFLGAVRAYRLNAAGVEPVQVGLIVGILMVSIVLVVTAGIFALQYLVFRLAKRRREKLREDDDADA